MEARFESLESLSMLCSCLSTCFVYIAYVIRLWRFKAQALFSASVTTSRVIRVVALEAGETLARIVGV
jgi:hypothetical protein